MFKRLIDIIVSFTLLALLSPLMLLVAILVFLKLDHAIIFRQTRAGLKGQPFTVYKFLSMTSQKDRMGNLLPDQDRLTHLGRWLRKTNLDELPQLWNILKGDMSFVGPRPLLIRYTPLYNAYQRKRLDVKPGLTGWAQVNGRNALSWDKKFELDAWYVDHASLALDFKIAWLTFIMLFKKSAVDHRPNMTMPEFKGNKL